MKLADLSQLAALSITEKVLLVEEFWDSIAKQSDAIDIPVWHEQALAEDAADYAANPQAGSSWEEVKQRIANHSQSKMA